MTMSLDSYFGSVNLSNGTSGGSITFDTNGSDRVAIVYVAMVAFVTPPRVKAPPTSTSGLLWKRRFYYVPQGALKPTTAVRLEVWWAHVPTAVTGEVVTFVFSGSTDSANLSVRSGIGCVDFKNPWSRDPSLPGFASANSLAPSQVPNCSTETANTITFGWWTSGTSQGNPHTALVADTGYTKDVDLYNPNPSNWNYNVAEYKVNTSQLSNATIQFTGGTSGDNSFNWAMVADALTDQPDNGEIYVENVENLFLAKSVGSGAIEISTLDADRILLLTFTASDPSVMPEVASVANTAGFVWARRAQLQSTSVEGPQALETWWAHATSDVDGDIVTATYTGTVDGSTLSIKAIANIVNLTAPWDTNSSLPAHTYNPTGTGSNTVVDNVSTDNADCLVVAAFTANTNQGNPSPLGPPSGYIMDCNLYNPNATDWNYNVAEYGKIDTALTLAVVEFTGGGSLTNWIMLADVLSKGSASGPSPPSAIMFLAGV